MKSGGAWMYIRVYFVSVYFKQINRLTHQLYGHLPPITKTIQVRRTRHARHCWRSRDELKMDPHIWPGKSRTPAWRYIQQLCEDTGCSPEDLPGRSGERGSRISVLAARHDDDDDIYIYIYIYIYIERERERERVGERQTDRDRDRDRNKDRDRDRETDDT